IDVRCTRAGVPCYALFATGNAGNYSAVLSGGRGMSISSADDTYSTVSAVNDGTAAGSYAVNGTSDYRAGFFQSNNTCLYGLVVQEADVSQSTAALDVAGTLRVEKNLVVVGSKTGYVVDAMQNGGSEALEAGDVVTIVGNSAPVLGQIPVVTVRKAN